MAERRSGRLDTPKEQRRPLLRAPSYDTDAFGVFAEQFARFMGTARFLMWMTVFVAFWVGWNTLAPDDLRFDTYPFIFLTLILSLQASYAAPLILLAQNRQELRGLLQELEESHSGEPEGGDHHDRPESEIGHSRRTADRDPAD